MSNVTDPELALMDELRGFLDAVDEPTRHRVLVWLVARYYPQYSHPAAAEPRTLVSAAPMACGGPFHQPGE